MRLKAPRWLLLLEAVLLLGVSLLLAYKAAMRVLPLGRTEQRRSAQETDPLARIMGYYRQFPERYIRITKESWQYDRKHRTAFHSFVLSSTATVAYQAIEIRFSYESSSGKALHTHSVKVPGILAASGTMKVTELKVGNVPAAAERVVAVVASATIVK